MANAKAFNQFQRFNLDNDRRTKSLRCLLVLITFCAIVCLGNKAASAQHSVAEFHKILREKLAFEQIDFAALEQGQTVVRLLPPKDKREVAVCGLVSLHMPSEVFLQSFRETMAKKSNPAILEIGRFSTAPTLDDLQSLTIENRDLDDLKECIVGDCRIKLSATMIERFRKEIDWEAPDYQIRATQLFRVMLLDYVRDYLARGDAALIEYHDKSKAVRVAEEQRALMAGSTYINNVLPEFPQQLKGLPKSGISIVEKALVWSKIKFGLKPVIAINHIIVYKREHETGPQVLITSKHIYANHYFDSSLALTAFGTIPGAGNGSYLFYENRSRADGLEGAFSGIKRGIVEDKAVASLKSILESSRANLHARTLSGAESEAPSNEGRSWRAWRPRRIHLVLLLLITGLIGLLTLGSYNWKTGISG